MSVAFGGFRAKKQTGSSKQLAVSVAVASSHNLEQLMVGATVILQEELHAGGWTDFSCFEDDLPNLASAGHGICKEKVSRCARGRSRRPRDCHRIIVL